jgi:hypothetical protein
MRLRRFLGLIVLAWAGCSSEEDGPPPPRTQCLSSIPADCGNSAIFTLATPLAGRAFAIAVGEMDGNVERLDCQPGDGSVACIPVPARLVPTFDATGALQSLTLHYPPTGSVDVQIVVDGTPAAAGSFRYSPMVTVSGPCGTTICIGSQTFTIGN